ncbi:MAG TPA: protein-L-isoaspartate(D-aspartate) O-methyltransferase [archaeon]|nr:protein-L-isoaspartate(D-aspartate) O-methyltransferase [archaeon]
MKNSELERKKLVEYLSGTYLKNPEIKKAFLEIKRENFLPKKYAEYAYADNALPIEHGQTISQPSTIAIMLELLEAKKGMTILEIGSGFGYVQALLSKIVGENGNVFGIEYIKELAEQSKKNLTTEGITNSEIKSGDGSIGWEEKAPFDRVLFSCACPFIPKPVFDQLKENGRIVAPTGDIHTQRMEIMKKIRGKMLKEYYEDSMFNFVPLRGKNGFQ